MVEVDNLRLVVEVDHLRLVVVEVLQVGAVVLEHREEGQGLEVDQEQGGLLKERRELAEDHDSLNKYLIFYHFITNIKPGGCAGGGGRDVFVLGEPAATEGPAG